jgi:HTH-type transcriptional regulator/antitoxin HipB
MDSVQVLGALIRKRRIDQGYTQQKFADLVGVGRRFLSELEAGKSTLEIGKVLQVAAAAGISILVRE